MQIDSSGSAEGSEKKSQGCARVDTHLQVLESPEMVCVVVHGYVVDKRVGPCGG